MVLHSRGCVRDKIASEWAGAEGWREKKRCQNSMDKRDFVTFALMKVKHSAKHRPQSGDVEVLLYNSVETTMWRNSGLMVTTYAVGKKYKETIGGILRTLHSSRQRKIAYPVRET